MLLIWCHGWSGWWWHIRISGVSWIVLLVLLLMVIMHWRLWGMNTWWLISRRLGIIGRLWLWLLRLIKVLLLPGRMMKLWRISFSPCSFSSTDLIPSVTLAFLSTSFGFSFCFIVAEVHFF
jgi:hypothetical protein